MSELNWNLLNTDAPAQIAASFNPVAAFQGGQQTAQKMQMNQLAMDKTRQDMEYNPMKLYSKMAEQNSRIAKNTAQTDKAEVETALKEQQLSMQFSLEAANATPGQLLPTLFKNIDKMSAATGKSPGEAAAQKQEYQALVDAHGEDKIKQHLFDSSQKIGDKIKLMLGTERNQISQTNAQTAQINAQTGQGNLAVNQQRVNQPNIIMANTGQELIPYDSKGGGTGDIVQPMPLQMRPGQERMIQVAEKNADTNKQRADQATGLDVENIDNLVNAIGTYKQPPLSPFAMSRPGGRELMNKVMEKYPNYDATTYGAKADAAKKFAGGRSGDQMRSFATATEHLTQLKGLVVALKNGELPIVNTIANKISTWSGGTAPTNFDATKNIVSQEITKAIVANGGGVEERKEAADMLKAARTTEQLSGMMDQYLYLMEAQFKNLEIQRDAAGISESTKPNYGNKAPTNTYKTMSNEDLLKGL